MDVIVTYINEIPIKRNFVTSLPYREELKGKAKALRKAGNYAEVAFWQEVKQKKFYTIDFDRQRIIGNYIVDFYIKALGVIIEIDGESHNTKEDYDVKRDNYLNSCGLIIFRTTNFKVLHDMENVLKSLAAFIIEHFGTDPI